MFSYKFIGRFLIKYQILKWLLVLLKDRNLYYKIFIEGTVSVISSGPPCKDSNAWFTTVQSTTVQRFSDQKVFFSVNFSIVSNKQEMHKSFCREKKQLIKENKQF